MNWYSMFAQTIAKQKTLCPYWLRGWTQGYSFWIIYVEGFVHVTWNMNRPRSTTRCLQGPIYFVNLVFLICLMKSWGKTAASTRKWGICMYMVSHWFGFTFHTSMDAKWKLSFRCKLKRNSHPLCASTKIYWFYFCSGTNLNCNWIWIIESFQYLLFIRNFNGKIIIPKVVRIESRIAITTHLGSQHILIVIAYAYWSLGNLVCLVFFSHRCRYVLTPPYYWSDFVLTRNYILQ